MLSVASSDPTTVAADRVPSAKTSSIADASSTTCSAVSTAPSAVTIVPLPIVLSLGSGSPRTTTIDGATTSYTSEAVSAATVVVVFAAGEESSEFDDDPVLRPSAYAPTATTIAATARPIHHRRGPRGFGAVGRAGR